MRVDLVRQDPQPARAGEIAQCHHLRQRHDPAGRVGGRVHHQEAGARGQRRLDVGQRQGEAPVRPDAVGHRHRHAAGDAHRLAQVRPGGGGDDDLVAGFEQRLHRLHHRVHAARGDGEPVRRHVHVPVPGVVGAERLAQAGQAERGGVARVPGQHRPVRRLDDEGRRRQVALADPQLHHLGVVPPAVGDLTDLARADAAHAGRQARSRIGDQTGGQVSQTGGEIGRRRRRNRVVHPRTALVHSWRCLPERAGHRNAGWRGRRSPVGAMPSEQTCRLARREATRRSSTGGSGGRRVAPRAARAAPAPPATRSAPPPRGRPPRSRGNPRAR